MSKTKVKGTCENCSKGGFLETVEVTGIDSDTGTSLRLCRRCETAPSAIWRRRYRPLQRHR